MVPEDPTPTDATPCPFIYVNKVPSGYDGRRCQFIFSTLALLQCDHRFIGGFCGLPVVEGQDRCILHIEGERDWRAVEEALREAVAAQADIGEANLEGAQLAHAHLVGANLYKARLTGAYLARADLKGAYLAGARLEGAYLAGAHLEGAYLAGAHLEGAYLAGAHLEGANLAGAHLDGADLGGAHLGGANLGGARFAANANLRRAILTDAHVAGAEFSPEADLDGVTWWYPRPCLAKLTGHTIAALIAGRGRKLNSRIRWWRRLRRHLRMFRDEGESERQRILNDCERTYRQIKRAYQQSGQYDMAGVFFIREMECKRKQAGSFGTRLAYSLVYFLSDYFENPARVGVISLLLILLFAWVQGALGIATDGRNGQEVAVIGPGVGLPTWTAIKAFLSEGCYFSVVTFTTLGYGDYHAAGPAGRVLASVEAILGAFMMALFLVCLARKYGRA